MEHPLPRCPHCKADLTKPESVVRTYVSKSDEHGDAYGHGHYDAEGCFEPDRAAHLGGGNYDLLDDSDHCAACEGQL